MKSLLYIFLLFLFSCQEKSHSKSDIIPIETSNESIETKPIEVEKESIKKVEKKLVILDHFKVNNIKGIPFYEKPNQKQLGIFSLNTYLAVIEKTDINDEILINEEFQKGEWFGIRFNKDTVYVFSAFLSKEYTFNNFSLYETNGFYQDHRGETKNAFLNVSESYFPNIPEGFFVDQRNKHDGKEYTFFNEENFNKNTVLLDAKQREHLLSYSKISENDTVYIYSINKDVIYKYLIKDLPAIAIISIYFEGEDDNKTELDYQFGFDLGNDFEDSRNFTFIGNQNPFQLGNIEFIEWEVTESDFVLNLLKDSNLRYNRTSFHENDTPKNAYKYSNDLYEFYIQNFQTTNYINSRKLIIIDSKTKEMVYNESFNSGESTHLNSLYVKGNTRKYDYQLTGEIFKNKAPILFGFTSESFGCPSIKFIDQTELGIYIKCDNRH